MKLLFVKLPVFGVLVVLLAGLLTHYGFWIETGNSTLADPVPWLLAAFLVFGAPHLWTVFLDRQRQVRWQRETALARLQQADAEEAAHQTALRRERERLAMQMELRIQELMAILEAQHRMDAAKLQQLQALKREFANRQQADLATLLGRLEAMRGPPS